MAENHDHKSINSARMKLQRIFKRYGRRLKLLGKPGFDEFLHAVEESCPRFVLRGFDFYAVEGLQGSNHLLSYSSYFPSGVYEPILNYFIVSNRFCSVLDLARDSPFFDGRNPYLFVNKLVYQDGIRTTRELYLAETLVTRLQGNGKLSGVEDIEVNVINPEDVSRFRGVLLYMLRKNDS
jgi:hypothetical protein